MRDWSWLPRLGTGTEVEDLEKVGLEVQVACEGRTVGSKGVVALGLAPLVAEGLEEGLLEKEADRHQDRFHPMIC